MKWAGLIFVLTLSGCGVIWPYAYDARDVEDRLSVAMSKDQVVQALGKPSRAMHHDDQTTVWEYWRYPKGEWFGYLIHCPFHPYCYIPAEPRNPYYVALRNDHVCLWGTPDLVRTLIAQVCTVDVPEGRRRGHGERMRQANVTVVPVFMPPRIVESLQRLAVMPVGETDPGAASWLDLTLNFLRSRHPQMVLVEREDLQALSDEVDIQYSGRVDDATVVRIGKLAGADSLLIYRMSVSGPGKPISATLELRVVLVESGTMPFRQTTTAISAFPLTLRVKGTDEPEQSIRRLVIEYATAYGLAALMAAFGDNVLGIVPDQADSHSGITLLGFLEDSPAARAGLRVGDRIVHVNRRPVNNWTDPLPVPARLGIDRDGERVEITVDGQWLAE
ncbi:MAG TPA: PDZ domain-containing protein [Nitrospiraceae bacterium]|nr:PDZ domain-containing protein [Nitrospiraceae bacterium]